MKFSLTLILIYFLFSSCEKEINFNLQQSPTRLVVDATIEDDMPPMIILSTSLDYFSQINAAILENSFVHNAVVTISNGTKTQQLKEYSIPADNTGYALYYYSIDSSNLANTFLGEFNTLYSLKIVANGIEYDAQTHITSVRKKIDSLSWENAPAISDGTYDIIMATITDPSGYGDYIRYYTKDKRCCGFGTYGGDSAFYPAYNSVYDDQITDGKTYKVQIDRGVNRNKITNQLIYNPGYFEQGDTVTVKFCNIDKATYDFWRTMEYDYQNIGNPFSSPTTVLGNISNNGLGAFCGYAAQYVQIVIPK